MASILKMASVMRENTVKALIDRLINDSRCDKTMIMEECDYIQDEIDNASNAGDNKYEVSLENKNGKYKDGDYTYEDISTIRGIFELLGYKVTRTQSLNDELTFLTISW